MNPQVRAWEESGAAARWPGSGRHDIARGAPRTYCRVRAAEPAQEDSVVVEMGAGAERTLDDLVGIAHRIGDVIESVIEGKPEAVRLALTVLLAEGHVLIEDVPGVGKTMLAKALARSIRLHGAAHPVHPGPAAQRHHRGERVQPGAPRLRVQARSGVREHRGRRRDQPGVAEDPVGAAGMHGRTAGDGGRHQLPAGAAVHGHRHPEPGGDGRHLPAARSAAGPVHRPHLHWLSECRGRAGHARPARFHVPAGLAGTGRQRRRRARADRGGAPGACGRRRSSST